MKPYFLAVLAFGPALAACHKPAHDTQDDMAMTVPSGDGGAVDSAMAPVDVGVDIGVDAATSKGPPYDWVGVIGTGQSLSVGATADDVSTTQPFHNITLVDTGPDPKYPIQPNMGSPKWATTPLHEPIRPSSMGSGAGYGDGQYPDNIDGETPHSGMANTLTTIWKARGNPGEYISAHSVVGWSGHCLSDIDKEGTGTAYPASIEETRVFNTLAKAAGKTYGVGGIVLTHGECDGGNPMYGTQLYKFWQDYDTDIKTITGQTRDPVLIISQQSTVAGGETGSAVQVWQAALAHPSAIVVSGPKYQYGYNPGLLHLPAPGYEEMGQKYAEVFDYIVNQGVAWKPLQPNKVTRTGAVVKIDFDVPNPPLVWDSHIPLPHQSANTEWMNGKGFEAKSGNINLTIANVAIAGSSVMLTLSKDPGATAKVTIDYALTQDGDSSMQWGGTAMGFIGALRDSDPFVGWDAETIAVQVTNGSPTVTTKVANGLLRRATKDIVSGAGVPADTVVLTYVNATQVTLTNNWPGATGTVMLSFRHDQYNYCVHSTMAEQ